MLLVAKQRRFDDFDGLLEESAIKPVQRSIIELSDEQDQPDLLPRLALSFEKNNWRLIKDTNKGNLFLIGVNNWANWVTETWIRIAIWITYKTE